MTSNSATNTGELAEYADLFSSSRVGEDGDWNTLDSIKTPNNGTHFKVEGLNPYTVYSFRVVAVNAMGASAPSKESYYMVTLREGNNTI